MKIRNGFVSNSSSSSFIISVDSFPSVRELAKYMIKRKIKDDESDDYNWRDEILDYNKKYLERLKNIDENQPVSFPSCNYDTYIKKIADCYLVGTCNNTDWDLYQYHTRLTADAKEALEELIKTPISNDERQEIEYVLEYQDEFSSIGKDYYALDSEVIGIETYDYCKTHTTTRMWDTVRHGKICLQCNPFYKRKDKLDQINKVAE